MSSIPSLTYGFPGGYLRAVPTIAALRATPSAEARNKDDIILCCGTLARGDGAGGVYTWDPTSIHDDDGQQTIRPYDVTQDQAGRWIWSIKAESAVWTQVQQLTAQYTDSVYGNLALKGSIDNEASIRFDADQVTVQTVQTLTATVEGNKVDAEAKITNAQTVSATATQAVADRTTMLETHVNDPVTGLARANAKITENATTASNQTQAVATRATTLESQMAGATGSALLSTITDTSNTLSNNIQAVANRVTAVEASTGDGLSARVTTVENAVATIGGKTQAYLSIAATDSSGTNSVVINSPNGGGIELTGAVKINGTLLVTNTVPTVAVAPNAITNGDVVASTGTFVGAGKITTTLTSYSVPDNAWVTLNTYTLNLSQGARLDVDANTKQAFQDLTGSGNTSWVCRINVNGSIIDDAWGQSPQDKMAVSGSINLGPGTYTILQQYAANGQVSAIRPKMRLAWRFK